MTTRRRFLKGGLSLLATSAIAAPLKALVNKRISPEQPTEVKSVKLRVLFASDGHYGQPDTPFEETHADIIRWINHEHEAGKIDFVIFNGDIVHDQPALLKVVKEKYFSQLSMPWYVLPGNHDHASPSVWKETFGYDVNYSFERDNIAFILANTSNEKGEYVCPDIQFLKTELDRYKNKEMVFIVMHIPPHQWLKEENYFTECKEVIELLHQYKNIKAVFHGHDHNLDSVRYTNGLPHFFDGHYGGNWGTNYRGFRILEIGSDSSIVTWQKNPEPEPVLNKNKI